jgi:transcriptional regulator with XRE-family HTH domain
MGFIQKRINPDGGLGHDLIELRTKAGLTRAEAAHLSKVSEGAIRSLEEERWEDISDPLYFEQVFRSYLSVYSIQQGYYLEKYRANFKLRTRKRTKEELLPLERVHWFNFTVWSRVFTILALVIFAGAMGGYVFYQVRAVTAAPSLVVNAPKEGERLARPVVDIQGKTESDASVLINGRPAIVEGDGAFKLTIDIPSGPTVIVIQAKKRRGKTAEETRHIFYQKSSP